MKRKHLPLFLLLLPILIVSIIFGTRSLLILRSNAEYDRIVRDLRQSLTAEVTIEEIGSYLREVGLNRPYGSGSNSVMAHHDAYRDGITSIEYAFNTHLGPKVKYQIVVRFTPDGKFD
jgi:hypothetical protein